MICAYQCSRKCKLLSPGTDEYFALIFPSSLCQVLLVLMQELLKVYDLPDSLILVFIFRHKLLVAGRLMMVGPPPWIQPVPYVQGSSKTSMRHS